MGGASNEDKSADTALRDTESGPAPVCSDSPAGTAETPSSSSARWASPTAMGKRLSGDVRVSSAAAGLTPSASCTPAGLAPHPDDFGDVDDADDADEVMDFHSIFVGSQMTHSLFMGSQMTSDWSNYQLEKVRFSCRQLRPSRLVTEGCPLLLTMLFTSTVSFGFVALFFRFAVSLPSPHEEAPEHQASWTACAGSDGQQAAVTELGRQLPFGKVRAMVSLPKFFDVATLLSLMGRLMSGKLSLVTCVHGLVQLGIATVTIPFFLVVEEMPTMVDPLINYSMLLTLSVVTAVWMVRPRRSSSKVVAKCPKLLYVMALCAPFLFGVFLQNSILVVVKKGGLEPGLVVCVAIICIRGIGFAMRQVLKGLKIPFLFCFALLFGYDVAMLVALRRYWLALPSLADVAISAVVSGAVECICNFAAACYAITTYNAMVEQGRLERASVQINIFFTAIISELIAEHVALHGSLGYNLFVDPRVLSVNIAPRGSHVTEAWALSFAIEIVVDLMTVAPMILFLPVSLRYLFGTCWRSWPAVVFILVICVHPHLVGLHTYVERDRYFCL